MFEDKNQKNINEGKLNKKTPASSPPPVLGMNTVVSESKSNQFNEAEDVYAGSVGEASGGSHKKIAILGGVIIGFLILAIATYFLITKISDTAYYKPIVFEENDEMVDDFYQEESEDVDLEIIGENPIYESTDFWPNNLFTGTKSATVVSDEMLDSDSDGLTDKEEELLGTDPFSVDTDGDGYEDLEEFLNLYDPAGPGKLVDNAGISLHDVSPEYEVLYPESWLKNIGIDYFILASIDGHALQIALTPNTEEYSIEEWYSEFVSQEFISADRIISFNGWDGIRSADRFVTRLTDEDRRYVFVISYIPSIESEPVYQNIYEMMLRSFKVK